MYMIYGCVEDAIVVFIEMKENSVSSWNTLIKDLERNCLKKMALYMFSKMKKM